jgi:Pyruvate/2-oxoglutarate dehydrogenase complex, dihydrolipoamide acyltransferase (E2) component, and related enzymes
MSFADIEKKIAEFGKKAKDGKLGIEEMTGGTSPSPTAAPSAR